MSSRCRSVAATGVLASLALAAPATALPPLQFDQPCYAEGGPIRVTGSGFTPSGAIDLIGGREGKAGSYELAADPAGSLDARLEAPAADRFLAEDEMQAPLDLVANDRSRANDGQPPDFESEAAVGRFTLSRYVVNVAYRVVDGRFRPGKPMMLDVHGFAHAVGKPLFVHWVRGGKRLASARLGVASGPCGDLRKTVKAFPFKKLRAGAYRVYVTTSATKAGDAEFWVYNTVTLARKDVPR